MKLSLRNLTSILAEWGIVPRRTPPSGAERRLVVSLDRDDGSTLPVGTLVVEPERFVFLYSREFKKSGLPSIPGFPDPEKRYESETLFPFFQLRIPPTDRSDVARVMREKHIDDQDVFEMLRTLGTRAAASPYHFS